jgi:hypothetical protein
VVFDIDGQVIFGSVIIVELDKVAFVCPWTLRIAPEIHGKRASKAIVITMEILTVLSNPLTFRPT